MPKSINIQDFQSVATSLSIPELEEYILTNFSPEDVDVDPKTEEELYRCYYNNTDYLYQYLRKTVGDWLFPLSNEVRAIMGHLADYRISDSGCDKKNLDKAYGHFRRLTLDAFKILCNEFDKSLSRQLKAQYSFDYRKVCVNYLDHFAEKYIAAKTKYIDAQCKEKLGSDHGKHNVMRLYYDAAKEYIELKQFYLHNKSKIVATQRKTKWKNSLRLIGTVFGIAVTVLGYLLA